MLNAVYTYGKSIDDASSIGGGSQVIVQDTNNLLLQRGLSTFDERQQLRLNYTYEIPLGDRHRFAQKGFSSALIGNWRLSGTIAAHTGTPYSAYDYNSACEILPGVYSERANAVSNPNLPASQQTPLEWFNTAAFTAPVGSCIGNAGRDTIIGPGAFTWNAQLAKTFAFGRDQQRHLEVRWESNNVTNTPNFTGLSTIVNSTTFGRVSGAATMRTMDFLTRINF
jgi:trimeric autotransporter adhesin